MTGLYLYALLGTAPEGEIGAGMAGEPLRLVCGGPRGGGVWAVVGEPGVLPSVSPEALSAHDAAVRRLAELAPAVLPVRFGQSLPDERALVDWLTARARDLSEALSRVEGCVQMTLRVFGGPDAPEPEPAAEDAGDPVLGPGARYLEARRRAAQRARALPEIAPLREALRPLLRAERIERAASKGRLLATAYDLVDRGEAREYARRVEEMAPRLGGFRVTASGPWPPYAFAPGLAG